MDVSLGLGATDRLLVAGPLYHVGAFDLPGVAVLWVGGMLSILRDFAPESALATIAQERLTGAWLAPVMLAASSPTPIAAPTTWRACAGWSAAASALPKRASEPSPASSRGHAMWTPTASPRRAAATP
jgi:hypothetical protein